MKSTMTLYRHIRNVGVTVILRDSWIALTHRICADTDFGQRN